MKIILWATAALIIPILGNTYVEGWNWTWHDFLFAWVFFVVLGLVVTFVRKRVVNKTARIAASVGVVFGFAAIWAMLATG